MSLRAARRFFALFFLLFALALTWPAAVPFSRIEPFVLGLPFAFFWVVLWVALSFLVFLVVHRIEVREGGEED